MNIGSYVLYDFILYWMRMFKKNSVKQSTYDRLITSIQALERYEITHIPIREITSIHIQRYVNELAQSGYGLSTIKKQIRIVTAPLKQAAAMHLIPADPAVGIKLPSKSNIKKVQRDVQAYSQEEQDRLAKRYNFSHHSAHALLAFMIETGLRPGEALALRWSDISIERKRLRVHATVVRLANKKTSYVQESPKSEASNRTVPLVPEAISILKYLRSKQNSEWVFPDEEGDHISYEALRYQTQQLCMKAGVKYQGMHIFRHTFATNCYYNGMDIKHLSKILGHADVNITYNIYIHLYGDGFDEMYSAMMKGAKKEASR